MRRLAVLLSLVWLVNTFLFSQGRGKPKTPVPVITGVEVFFDPTPGTILISGIDFDSPIQATLFAPAQGEIPLAVINFDPVNQEILAELPSGVQDTPGTFLSKVTALGIVSDGFPATIGQRIPGYERMGFRHE